MQDPIWKPHNIEQTQMWQFTQFINLKTGKKINNYNQLHQWSIEHSATFWQLLCEFYQLTFNQPPSRILNDYNHMIEARWFEDATFNFAEKLLQGTPQKTAIISLDEQGNRLVLSYSELKKEVMRFASGLKAHGIQTGDRVAAYMPNTADTIIAFLGTASIGAIWSSCSPDFGLGAAVDRLGQITPKLLIMSTGHQYNGKSFDTTNKATAFKQAIPSIEHIVLCPDATPHEEPRQADYVSMLEAFKCTPERERIEFTPFPFNHPLYILFSSGTTGRPKCIVHSTGGALIQHIKELGLHTDIKPCDNLLFYTTCGWMMWNWMVSVLSLGATLTLYDGAPTYPKPDRLFKIVEEEKVTVFGTSAKFLSALEKSETYPSSNYKLSDLRCILSTGSPLLPQNYDFVYQHIKGCVQLASISGGTDIVSCFALGNPMLPIYRGELQCLGLGMSVKIYNDEGQAVTQTQGEMVCTQPFPSMPIRFWNDSGNKKYKSSYFERFNGVWAHGDYAEITEHQGLIIYGRSDAILNPGGVRIGTAEIYRQIEKIPEIIDSVVVGQNWKDDVRVILFVKLKANVFLDAQLKEVIRQTIRQNASPRHVPAKIIEVDDIPRTMSNKVVELAVRDVIHNREIKNKQSLANPEALAQYRNLSELQKD